MAPLASASAYSHAHHSGPGCPLQGGSDLVPTLGMAGAQPALPWHNPITRLHTQPCYVASEEPSSFVTLGEWEAWLRPHLSGWDVAPVHRRCWRKQPSPPSRAFPALASRPWDKAGVASSRFSAHPPALTNTGLVLWGPGYSRCVEWSVGWMWSTLQ